MKDDRGMLYYYPFPQNKRVRMYVRQSGGSIEFRLWNADDPKLWIEHGWVTHEAVEQATRIYSGKGGIDPKSAYDIKIARTLIREENEKSDSR